MSAATQAEPTSAPDLGQVDTDGSRAATQPWLLRLEQRASEHVERSRREALEWSASVPEENSELRRRLELVVAVCDLRLGRFEQGASALSEIRAWAVDRGARVLQARTERCLSTLFRRAGELATGLAHAATSVALLRPDDPLQLHIDHLLGLADALSYVGDHDEAGARYLEALAVARRLGDDELLARVVNNLAYAYVSTDRIAEAVPWCDELSAMREGGTYLAPYALCTLADTYLAAGLLDRASEVFGDFEIADGVLADDLLDVRVAQSRIERRHGRPDTARELLVRGLGEVEGQDAGELEVIALQELAGLSAALGEWETAFTQMRECHERNVRQSRLANQARVQMAQAMFEVTEARRQSEAFRELSYRDPLTGLHNRRYVDDHLGPLLRETLAAGAPCSVAALDLDHFKDVNDTYSHQTGDEVLELVAELLTAAVSELPAAMAARIGGEEFLVVLPGLDPTGSVVLLDGLRRAVASQDWSALGIEVPVSASIGVATATFSDAADCADLIAAADRLLYEAKAAGRNRIVSG